MVKILRSRRRRWRGVPLGAPLQARGASSASPPTMARPRPMRSLPGSGPEIVLAGRQAAAPSSHAAHSERWRFRAQLRSRAATLRQSARVIEDSRRLRSTARAVTTKMLISLGRPSAICSSVRRPCALRARDTYQVSKMSSQDVLRLSPLLTAHSTWQHLQSLEDKERSPSKEASS